MCDMTHPYVWHDLFICVKWLILNAHIGCLHGFITRWFIQKSIIFLTTRVDYSYVRHSSSTRAGRLNYMRCLTHSHVWYDSSIKHTSGWWWWTHYTLIYLMMHYLIDVTHDSFICVTWLIHVCDMTHPYVWHNSFIYMTWLIYNVCI